jgi:hypothetical protein
MARFRLRADGAALFAFLILVLALAEAHECAHIFTARAICGGWGARDFSLWATRDGCAADHPLIALATFAGPMLTYAVIWIGASLTARAGDQCNRAPGLALIFAPLPFARIFTAISGHGDEVSGFTGIFGDHRAGWAAGLAAVLLLSVFPLAQAHRCLVPERRILIFSGLLLVPMLVHGAVVHGAMSRLLASGFFARDGIFGSPTLINVWQAAVLTGAILTGRKSARLFADS